MKEKKLLSMLMAVVLLPLSVFADEYWYSGVGYSYDRYSKVAHVTGGANGVAGSPGARGDVKILSEFTENGRTYVVTSIDSYAFLYCDIESVTIPGTVESISTEAFFGCSKLSKVELSEGLKSISTRAFGGCNSLSEINLPYSLTTLGSSAFLNCSKLTHIEIPEEITEIYQETFSGCKMLADVRLPQNFKKTGRSAFRGCVSLTKIDLPEGMTEIGEASFSDCTGLTTVILSSSLEVIGNSAFSQCKSLKSVAIPANVKTIGQYAFANCDGLESVTSLCVSPSAINPNVFFENVALNTFTSATLYVPKGCKDIYEATSGWSLFKTVVEIGSVPTVIDNVAIGSAPQDIYTINGCKTGIYRLSHGLYIVNGKKVLR